MSLGFGAGFTIKLLSLYDSNNPMEEINDFLVLKVTNAVDEVL